MIIPKVSYIFLFLLKIVLIVRNQPSSECSLSIHKLITGIQGSLCESKGYSNYYYLNILNKSSFINYGFSFWIKPESASQFDQVIAAIHSTSDLIEFNDKFFGIMLDQNLELIAEFYENNVKMRLQNQDLKNQWNYVLVTVSQTVEATTQQTQQNVAIFINKIENKVVQVVQQVQYGSGTIKLTLLTQFNRGCLKNKIAGFYFLQNIDTKSNNWEFYLFKYFLQGGIFSSQIIAHYSIKYEDKTITLPDNSGNQRHLYHELTPYEYEEYYIGRSQTSIITQQEEWQLLNQQDRAMFNNFMISFQFCPQLVDIQEYLIYSIKSQKQLIFDVFYKKNDQQKYELFANNKINPIYTSSKIKEKVWVRILLKFYFDPIQQSHLIYVEEDDEQVALNTHNVTNSNLYYFQKNLLPQIEHQMYNNLKYSLTQQSIIEFVNEFYSDDKKEYYVGFGNNEYIKNYLVTSGSFSFNKNDPVLNPSNCSYLNQCSSIQGILGSKNEKCVACENGYIFDRSSLKCQTKCAPNKQQINGECFENMYNWGCNKFDKANNQCMECNEGRILSENKYQCNCKSGYFDDRRQSICLQQFRHQTMNQGQFNFAQNFKNQSVCTSENSENNMKKYICRIVDQSYAQGYVVTSVVGIDITSLNSNIQINYEVYAYVQLPSLYIQVVINDAQLIINEFIISYMVIQDTYLYETNYLSVDFTKSKSNYVRRVIFLNQNFIDKFNAAIFLTGMNLQPPIQGQTDNSVNDIKVKSSISSLILASQQEFTFNFEVSQRIQSLSYSVLFFSSNPAYDNMIDLTSIMDQKIQMQQRDNSYSPLLQYDYFLSTPLNFNELIIYGLNSFQLLNQKDTAAVSNKITFSFQNTYFDLSPLQPFNNDGQDQQMYRGLQNINKMKINLSTKDSQFIMSNFVLSLATSFSKCSKNCESCNLNPAKCTVCSNPYMDINYSGCTKCKENYVSDGVQKCRAGQVCGKTTQQAIFECKTCNLTSRDPKCSVCIEGYKPNQFYSECIKDTKDKSTSTCHQSCQTCSDSTFFSCQSCSSNQNNILISNVCYCNGYTYRFNSTPDCEKSQSLEILFKFEYIIISLLTIVTITQAIMQETYCHLWKYIEMAQLVSSLFYYNTYGLTLLDLVYRLAYLYNLSPIFPNPFTISALNNQDFQKLQDSLSSNTPTRFLANYKSSNILHNIIPTVLFYFYLIIVVMVKQFILFRSKQNHNFFEGFKIRIYDALLFGFYFQGYELILLILMHLSRANNREFTASFGFIIAILLLLIVVCGLVILYMKKKKILSNPFMIQLIGIINLEKKRSINWPAIRMIQKIILAILLVFFQKYPKAQAAIFCINVLSLLFFHLSKPLQNMKVQNHLLRLEMILIVNSFILSLLVIFDNQLLEQICQIILFILTIIQLLHLQYIQIVLIYYISGDGQTSIWKYCQNILTKSNILSKNNDEIEAYNTSQNILELSMTLQNNNQLDVKKEDFQIDKLDVQWQANPIYNQNKKASFAKQQQQQ